MERNVSVHDLNLLYRQVIEILMKKGFKATTMDVVAAQLGMSKRTLYEIFDSKQDLIEQTLKYVGERHKDFINRALSDSPNVMEAMLRISIYFGQLMEIVDPIFFRDMDDRYPEIRQHYDDNICTRSEVLMKLFSKGVEQGVFRTDVDYTVHIRMLDVLLEGLKKMENIYTGEITIARFYRAMTMTILRGIATPEGMKVLEEAIARYDAETPDPFAMSMEGEGCERS